MSEHKNIIESLRPLALPISDLSPDPANARLHGDKVLHIYCGFDIMGACQKLPLPALFSVQIVENSGRFAQIRPPFDAGHARLFDRQSPVNQDHAESRELWFRAAYVARCSGERLARKADSAQPPAEMHQRKREIVKKRCGRGFSLTTHYVTGRSNEIHAKSAESPAKKCTMKTMPNRWPCRGIANCVIPNFMCKERI